MKLMQFLMGLNEIYQPIRSSILSKETLPDIKDAFVTIPEKSLIEALPLLLLVLILNLKLLDLFLKQIGLIMEIRDLKIRRVLFMIIRSLLILEIIIIMLTGDLIQIYFVLIVVKLVTQLIDALKLLDFPLVIIKILVKNRLTSELLIMLMLYLWKMVLLCLSLMNRL